MIGEDFDSGRRSGSSSWPFGVLIISKALRVIALIGGFGLLHYYDFPVVLYTFYSLLGASLLVTLLQQPWKGRPLQSTQWAHILFQAALYLISLIFWNIGLKYYGPIRTILSSDHADLAFAVLFNSAFQRAKFTTQSSKSKGAIILMVAYLLIFWVEPSTTPWADGDAINPNIGNPEYPGMGDGLNNNNNININSNPAHTFSVLGLFSVSETKVGGFCLFLAILVNMIRKNTLKKLHTEVIGAKRAFGLMLPVATVMLSPFALVSYWNSTVQEGLFSSNIFPGFLGIVLFSIISEFYVESLISKQMEMGSIAMTGITTSFLVACSLEWYSDMVSTSMLTFLCFFLILWGMYMIFRKPPSQRDLPVYANPIHMRGVTVFSASFFKIAMKQIWEGRDSRRIFLYLCVNLCFMFVEMIYGVWTNSLGLISDACHMLFDCTALVIGLFAAVIANWEPTQIYSYGYGRVEVLSGFVNGIFLVFIAFYILLESAERLYHPQEINTDKLLLVSTLGLVVNLIGVFAFHDLHDHSDHGGHSHSHGHGHGHGHGHEHKHKDKKKKEKHGHSHGHGHEDHHDEHEEEHHGHDHDEKKEEKKKKKKKANNSNLYGVYLHIIADTMGSVGVIISSLIIEKWGLTIADPICSLCISIMIVLGVVPLITGSGATLLQCTPEEFEEPQEKCLKKVKAIQGVIGYRNPHFWKHNKDIIIGTIHIQINNEASQQKVLQQVTALFKEKGIKNMTVEVERVST